MKMEEARERLLSRLRQEIGDPRVVEAMERVPRERFVPEEMRHMAYTDMPLPIGYGQTISQPFIVALMVEALELKPTDRVLEVGTGSGYQAAVMAHLAREVVTVERIPQLAQEARRRLEELGYHNVEVVVAEDGLGWPPKAPYDAIVVAAAAPRLPRGLMDQLALGGRLVVPVGSLESQELMKVVRTGQDAYSVRSLGGCRFVPLIGQDAWSQEEAGDAPMPPPI